MEKRKHASPQQTIVLHSVQSLAEVVERLRLKPGFRIGKHLGNLEFGRSNYDPDIRTRTYDATYVTSMEIPREVQTTKEPIIYRLYARINLYSIRDDLTKIELKIAIETQWLENWILANRLLFSCLCNHCHLGCYSNRYFLCYLSPFETSAADF